MARKHNIVIVGAGLFGSIAARLARDAGHTVTVIDANLPFAASKASGCVLAPSWLNSMERSQIDTSLAILDELYGLIPLELHSNLGKVFKAQRVNLSDVLVKPDLELIVDGVTDGVVPTPAGKYRGKVLVAAGVKSFELLSLSSFPGDLPRMKALWGASLTFNTQLKKSAARLHVYAPYKQAVAFNNGSKHVWMGDGTSLVEATWAKQQEGRVLDTMRRAKSLFGLPAVPPVVNVGARPCVEGYKAGFFGRLGPHTWVSTGGAKNGTVLAAWQAYQFLQELK